MLLLATIALAIALSVPGIVLAVRALPPVARLVDAGVKPWACDVCSCFWITGFLAVCGALALHDATVLLCCGPAYTVAMLILARLQQPSSAPLPPPPELPGLAERIEP